MHQYTQLPLVFLFIFFFSNVVLGIELGPHAHQANAAAQSSVSEAPFVPLNGQLPS